MAIFPVLYYQSKFLNHKNYVTKSELGQFTMMSQPRVSHKGQSKIDRPQEFFNSSPKSKKQTNQSVDCLCYFQGIKINTFSPSAFVVFMLGSRTDKKFDVVRAAVLQVANALCFKQLFNTPLDFGVGKIS